MTPLVVAGCPARNRAWSLPGWYTALREQTVKPDAVYVLLNGEDEDDSARLLSDLAFCTGEKWGAEACPVAWERSREEAPPGWQRGGGYNAGDHAHLAAVRNEWIERALGWWPDATHLWSVDSDIVPDPNVLALLLAADVPVVAAVVRNSTAEVYNFMFGRDEGGPRRNGHEVTELNRGDGGILRASLTGARCLYRRDVLDAGIRFGAHARGEDMAFCTAATAAGFPIYVHPRAHTRHYMVEGEEPLR